MKFTIFLGLVLLALFTFGCLEISSAATKTITHFEGLSGGVHKRAHSGINRILKQHFASGKQRHLNSKKRMQACLMKIRKTCNSNTATCARFAHGNLCRHFDNDCARLSENCKQLSQVYTAVDINMCHGVTSTRTLPCKSNALAEKKN